MCHVSNIWTACMPTLNFVNWLNHAGVVRDFLQIHNRISTVWPCIDLKINGYTMTTGLFKKRGCGIVIRLEFQVIMCDGIQTIHCLLHVFLLTSWQYLSNHYLDFRGLQRKNLFMNADLIVWTLTFEPLCVHGGWGSSGWWVNIPECGRSRSLVL